MGLFSKKIRKSTGKKEPFDREGKEDPKYKKVRERIEKAKGPYQGATKEDVEEMNEARKKWLKSRSKKK